MCLSGRGLVVAGICLSDRGFGGRYLGAFQLGVVGRQLCALLLVGCWWAVISLSVRGLVVSSYVPFW
jgi:hypothetical protein